MWVPMCRVLLCCFAWLIEMSSAKDKTQAQQKRYRYTDKEKDDSSSLCYYGARYLAPWLTRWISPDSAGAVDGYVQSFALLFCLVD
jgi:RHS repeat-associated protein